MDETQIRSKLQALVDSAVRPRKGIVNAVMGAAYGEHFTWEGAAGQADAGRPMRADTPFLIASITKMFTAAAAWILHSRGTLRLDDPVDRYLDSALIAGLHHGQGGDHTGALTVRHLITQTSGLPDYFLDKPAAGERVFDRLLTGGDRAWELEDVIQITREAFPAKFAPAPFSGPAAPAKRKAHYSDTNYKLLGRIIEVVEGKPLAAVFQELFFDPFDLRQTYLFGSPPAGQVEPPARVYYKERPMQIDRLMASHGPEGGIVSTVSDLLRFGRAYFSGELFAKHGSPPPEHAWNAIFFPFAYGVGLMRFQLPRLMMPFGYSPTLTGHSGSSGSFLYYDPALDLVLAGTINQMAQRNLPVQLMLKAAQIFAQHKK